MSNIQCITSYWTFGHFSITVYNYSSTKSYIKWLSTLWKTIYDNVIIYNVYTEGATFFRRSIIIHRAVKDWIGVFAHFNPKLPQIIQIKDIQCVNPPIMHIFSKNCENRLIIFQIRAIFRFWENKKWGAKKNMSWIMVIVFYYSCIMVIVFYYLIL